MEDSLIYELTFDIIVLGCTVAATTVSCHHNRHAWQGINRTRNCCWHFVDPGENQQGGTVISRGQRAVAGPLPGMLPEQELPRHYDAIITSNWPPPASHQPYITSRWNRCQLCSSVTPSHHAVQCQPVTREGGYYAHWHMPGSSAVNSVRVPAAAGQQGPGMQHNRGYPGQGICGRQKRRISYTVLPTELGRHNEPEQLLAASILMKPSSFAAARVRMGPGLGPGGTRRAASDSTCLCQQASRESQG
jgi:hypothetical protein